MRDRLHYFVLGTLKLCLFEEINTDFPYKKNPKKPKQNNRKKGIINFASHDKSLLHTGSEN
jgi:hypothetical protein